MVQRQNFIFIKLIFFYISFTVTEGSVGDKSNIYNRCLYSCQADNCINEEVFKTPPSLFLKLLSWTCKEDCSYDCMWIAVQHFEAQNLPIPQFYGKWPFVRMFGIQEPASVLFSLLNFFEYANNFVKFRKVTSTSSPLFFIWSWFTVICLHGWMWSAIFHARDNSLTEAMDYSCAFSIVLTLFYCLLLRLTYKNELNLRIFLSITTLYLSILYTHVSYLFSGRINYGYNMRMNICIGFLTFLMSMIWWLRNHQKLPHIQFMGWFTILTVLATLLELADFPPIFWIFDAHSLWHASTIPLVHILYKFLTMDCLYLRRQYMKLKTDNK